MANNSAIMSINVDSRLDFIKCLKEQIDLETPLDIIIQDAPVLPRNNNNQLDLPKPSFRLAENYEYRKRVHTASSKNKNKKNRLLDDTITRDSYYRYYEPTPEELIERVEYDMDEQDSHWLKALNEDNSKEFSYEVQDDDFERIMDRLEKESYFESKKSGEDFLPEVDEDALCAICNDGDSPCTNNILFCDMCDLAVHQECYGVPYIPEGQWLCRRCLQSPSENVSCCLCPNKGGAFKQTDDNRWAHVICALWIPEVNFANTVFLEPIDALDQIPQARWKLTCYICKQKKSGACIQCHKANCYVPFHVTCAQQANLYMKIKKCKYETPDGIMADVCKEAFCDAHGPEVFNNGGMYADNDEVIVSDPKKYKSWKKGNRDKMKKTRRILAEKRERAFNPVAEPNVKDERLAEIARQLLPLRGRKKPASTKEFEKFREVILRKIKGYWIEKRKSRKGVPLLRRLQVSYNGNVTKANASLKEEDAQDLDTEKYKRLRYDLEKARLLVGEVKRRELFKKKMFFISRNIVAKRYEIIDKEHPPIDD